MKDLERHGRNQLTSGTSATPQYVQIIPAAGGEEEFGLLEYYSAIMRRKWAIALIAILGALAGFAVTLPQPPVYHVSTLLEVKELNDSFLNMRDLDPNARNTSDESRLRTEMKMLESKSLKRRVQEQMEKEPGGVRIYQRDQLSTWLESLGLPTISDPPSRGAAIWMAGSTLSVNNPSTTRVVEVTCDSTDPQVAAEFVNTLVKAYMEESVEGRISSAAQTSEWLDDQLEEIRANLQQSENRLVSYANKSGLMLSGEEEDKLLRLQAELMRSESDLLRAQSRSKIASSSALETVPDVMDNPFINNYKSQLQAKKNEYVRLSSIHTPDNFKMKRLRTEIEALERGLTIESQKVVERLEKEYEEAKLRLDMQREAHSTQSQQVAGQSERMIQYNMLKREVDTNRQLYESMLQKVREADITSALRASNLRVVDPAEPPSQPYRPRPVYSGIIGLSMGLFCGVMFVAIRHSLDRRFRDPGDISTYLRLPELGVIPAAGREIRGHVARRALESIHTNREPQLSSEVVTVSPEKPSLYAESFRGVLVSLMTERDRKVFVVTSPGPGEGKSSVISNLAAALAEIDRRVLLVDGDLRQPRLHEIFDIPNSWGLSDVCNNGSGLPASSSPAEGFGRRTAIPSLFLLPSGPAVANISRLIHSEQLDEFLRRARDVFDIILIDTPPVLHIPDARVLGLKSDGIILVFRAGRTTRETGELALARLNEDGTFVVGSILNAWNPKNLRVKNYYKSSRYLDGEN